MNLINNHIDELFKNELGNYEINPTEDVWLNIEKKLDKKTKVRSLYFKLGFAAGIAILIGVSGLLVFNSTQNTQSNIAENTIISSSIVKQSTNNKEITPKNKQLSLTKVSSAEPSSINNTIEGYSQANAVPNQININPNEEFTTEAISNIKDNQSVSAEAIQNIAYIEPLTGLIPSQNTHPEIRLIPQENSSQKTEEVLIANSDPKPKINRWSVEAQVAPTYAYRNISGTSPGYPDESTYNQNEDGMVSYANAIKVNYKATKKIHFQFGFAYSVIGQIVNNVYVKQPADNLNTTYRYSVISNSSVNSSMGNISNNNTSQSYYNSPLAASQTSFFNNLNKVTNQDLLMESNLSDHTITSSEGLSISQRLELIEIPVMAKYTFLDKKVSLYFLGGTSVNFLIGNNAILETHGNEENIGTTPNLKTLNFVGIIGSGIGYKVKQNITVYLEPTFKYFLNSITRDNSIKVHPYSFGIFTGIGYSF